MYIVRQYLPLIAANTAAAVCPA